MFKLVKKHKQNKRMYSITSDAKKYLNEINLKLTFLKIFH